MVPYVLKIMLNTSGAILSETSPRSALLLEVQITFVQKLITLPKVCFLPPIKKSHSCRCSPSGHKLPTDMQRFYALRIVDCQFDRMFTSQSHDFIIPNARRIKFEAVLTKNVCLLPKFHGQKISTFGVVST